MADISSRSFEGAKNEMTNTEFQLFFDSKFPLPQGRSWNVVILTKEHAKLIYSALIGQLLKLGSWMTKPKRNIGPTGVSMPKISASTHTFKIHRPRKRLKVSKHSMSGPGVATMAEERRLAISQLTKLGAPSIRPVHWSDCLTHPNALDQTTGHPPPMTTT
jgi:hypothetical protein